MLMCTPYLATQNSSFCDTLNVEEVLDKLIFFILVTKQILILQYYRGTNYNIMVY